MPSGAYSNPKPKKRKSDMTPAQRKKKNADTAKLYKTKK